MTGTINKDLIRYILQLEESQQQELLSYVKQLLEKESLNAMADKAQQDIKEGKVRSFDEFEKEARGWIKARTGTE